MVGAVNKHKNQTAQPENGGRTSRSFAKTGKTRPFQVLVNYWEVKPAQMGAKLNHLLRQGVNHIASFVPWQASESDISHSLVRFLQAVGDRQMAVSLILTPDLGVYYPYSGLAKDLAGNADTLAKTADEKTFQCALPPNFFSLPSLHSKEFLKRYHQFLTRIDSVISEVGRSQPNILQNLEIVLTGSYWKYYRSAMASSLSSYQGLSGDFSNQAELGYRSHLDLFYAQDEFTENGTRNPKRWKTAEMEGVNRQTFQQTSEEVFRIRSSQFLRKKCLEIDVTQAELFTPDADPSYQYSQIFQLISRGLGDFHLLDRLVQDAVSRQSMVGTAKTRTLLHWTGFGGFAHLADPEKQFLLLRSLLLIAGNGGSIIVDESQWASLSPAFRGRLEMLARAIENRDLGLEVKALCLTPHLWSEGKGEVPSPLFWPELQVTLEQQATLIASVDALDWFEEVKVLAVEPSVIFTLEKVRKILHWASGGRIVALPRSALFTEAARIELEQSLKVPGTMSMNLGVHYRLSPYGQGKVIVYELGAQVADWRRFVAQLLSIAEISREAASTDPRVSIVELSHGSSLRSGKAGIFVFNRSRKPCRTEISFEHPVNLSDLTTLLSGGKKDTIQDPGKNPIDEFEHSASRYELEVPSCGVLPMAVSGLGDEGKERKQAALTDDLSARYATDAAHSELSGFSDSDPMENAWN